jgi:hypothetical protein
LVVTTVLTVTVVWYAVVPRQLSWLQALHRRLHEQGPASQPVYVKIMILSIDLSFIHLFKYMNILTGTAFDRKQG